jgi:hypothetical protein
LQAESDDAMNQSVPYAEAVVSLYKTIQKAKGFRKG